MVNSQRIILALWSILFVQGQQLATADVPKAISVSPMAIAPGRTTVVSINGLNLKQATEVWTNLPATVVSPGAATAKTAPLESVLASGQKPPAGSIIREAESYDRGQFRKSGIFILNGNFTPNYAEWDFDIPKAGRFLLELKYAAGAPRPVKLLVNGVLINAAAADGETGGFSDVNSKWMVEGVLELAAGKNTVRLERPGGTPHFDKVGLVPTQLPASHFSTIAASDRIAPFKFDVPEDTPVGIRGLRVATQEGISNMLLFMVDDLPTVKEIREKNSGANAQAVRPPIAIEGYCDVGQPDRYSFQAKAGESISIEAVAARLGSKLDPVIRLLDANERELAFVDDSAGLSGDCLLRHQFSKAGEYIVTIEDSLMSGASAHKYRLRIGDFPLLATPIPGAVQRGMKTSVGFAGPAVSGIDKLDIVSNSTATTLHVSAPFPGKVGSGFSELVISDHPQVVINASSSTTVVPIPVGISGVIKQSGESHSCRLSAKKGDRIHIVDRSRSRGIPAVLGLAVKDLQGKVLAQLRKAGAAGRQLTWVASQDADYELQISELTGRGGPEFGYHVEVARAVPDFNLVVEKDSTILPQDGYTLLKVTANRLGYNGPIQLNVKGLGSSVRLRNDVIAAKTKETRLKIYLPTDVLPGQTRKIEIIGTATIDQHKIERPATTLAAIRKTLPNTPFPPTELQGLVAATAGLAIPDFFALSLDDNAVLFPRFVGEVYFTVRVKDRAKGFKNPVNIRIEGLPQGFRAGGGDRPVSRSDNNEYRFQLNGPKEIGPGQHAIRIVAEASFKGQTKEVELLNQPLKYIKPLMIAARSKGPLTPGTRQTLTIKARRFVPRAGGDKKRIDLKFESLPVGVTVPTGLFIPAGKNEITANITIGPNVVPTSISKILVTAQTVVAEHPVSVSAPITIGLGKSNSGKSRVSPK